MNADECGGMEFLESMIAVMVVAVVLTAFLGMAASNAATDVDPTDGLDGSMFTGSIVQGEFVPSFEAYLEGYVESRGLSGATVSISLPGGLFDEPEDVVVGSTSQRMFSDRFLGMADVDDGRRVPVVCEVVLCARTPAGSWP